MYVSRLYGEMFLALLAEVAYPADANLHQRSLPPAFERKAHTSRMREKSAPLRALFFGHSEERISNELSGWAGDELSEWIPVKIHNHLIIL
jgi:hypothetical protein